MWQSYMNGMLVAFGLIMAIGTQNAFVLAQSLRREHHVPVALLCVACDALLVAAGVFGLATVLAHNPMLLAAARWGGALFLIWYGAKALQRACAGRTAERPRRLCGRGCERFAGVVLHPRAGRRLARALAGAPDDLAIVGPDGRGDDVRGSSAVDSRLIATRPPVAAATLAPEPLIPIVVAWLCAGAGAMIERLRRKE